MKVYKPVAVESGFYPWGPLSNYRTLAVTFEGIEDQNVKCEKDEDYEKLSKEVFKDFQKYLKDKGYEELYKSFTNPKILGDKTRFLFRGVENDFDTNARTQITKLFNRVTESAIITEKLTGSKSFHPICFDIETKPLATSMEAVLTKTPRFVQENSWYRKFNCCLVKLDVAEMRKDMKSVVGSVAAWKEIEYHGQNHYGFIVHSSEDCGFIQQQFIDSNLMTDQFPGKVWIIISEEATDKDKIVEWAFENSFRINNPVPEYCKDHYLKF